MKTVSKLNKCIAHAKLNLSLDIIGRREDGMHLLESTSTKISLHDILEINESDHHKINILNNFNVQIDIQYNTISVALSVFKKYTGIEPRLDIILQKNIPIGSGMGGGSADAAAVLKYLCTRNNIDENQMIKWSVEIGADVPGCFYHGCIIMSGIGEKIRRLDYLSTLYFIIVTPNFPILSGDAYREYAKSGMSFSQYRKFINCIDVIQNGKNDLEIALLKSHDPKWDKLKCFHESLLQNLQMHKIQYLCCRMTGSGSSYFIAFEERSLAQECKEILNLDNCNILLVESV